MVGARPNVDPQGPDFTVLRVTVLVYLGVGVAVWRTTASRPVDSSHVEIDVVHHRDLRVVLLDVVLRPVVRAPLASLLARPEAEDHRPPALEVSQGLGGLHHHRRAGRVVVCASPRPIGPETNDMRVQKYRVGRRGHVEVRPEHHPLVRDYRPPLVRAYVVRLWVLHVHYVSVLVPVGNDLKTESLQLTYDVQGSVLVSGIALAGPPVEVARLTVHGIQGVGGVRELEEPVIDHTTMNEATRVPPSILHGHGVPNPDRRNELHRDGAGHDC